MSPYPPSFSLDKHRLARQTPTYQDYYLDSITMAFNLTLELTKVVPIGFAVSTVGGALMSLARDLQASGSDIVVEEDLLRLFGAGLMERQMESSFKTIIGRAASSTPLFDSLFLSGGPGPTVKRTFQEQSAPYFAMVIQCSLLSSVHSVGSLAAALRNIFELHIEQDTKNGSSMVLPTVERIKGFLQTCQDQTAAFDWSGLLFAVAKSLDMPDDDDGVSEPLMPHILHGALVMFPKVQRFPEEHIVQISSPGWNCGYCLLVVWSHHVLGLTTVVRYRDLDGTATEFRFEGPNTKQDSIIIDIAGPDGHKITAKPEPSITLLSASKDEKNLTISPDQDEDEIESLL